MQNICFQRRQPADLLLQYVADIVEDRRFISQKYSSVSR